MRTSAFALVALISSNVAESFVNLHYPNIPNVKGQPMSLGMTANPASSTFLTPELAKSCIDVAGGSPTYAYSLASLEASADSCLAFPNAYGLTVRYAAKACPNGSILKFFSSKGIQIDASSGYEVRRVIAAGIPPENISLSSQELPQDFAELIDMGVKVNAW